MQSLRPGLPRRAAGPEAATGDAGLEAGGGIVLRALQKLGKRVVVCMRSAACWGLESGKRYGIGLFAPLVNRSGHFLKNEDNRKLIEIVREQLLN